MESPTIHTFQPPNQGKTAGRMAPLSRSVRGPLCLGALALLVTLLAIAAPAGAATYTVYSCRGPEGLPISTRAWQADEGDLGVEDTCADDGSLSASINSGRGKEQLSGLRFMTPAGTVIAGYRINLTAATGYAAGLEAGLATGSLLGTPDVTQGCTGGGEGGGCTFGDPGEPLADANLVTSAGLPDPALALVAECHTWLLGLGGCFGESQNDALAEAHIWRSAVDLLDDDAPQLGDASGSLLGPGAASGRAAISAAASDVGGGVAAVLLRIDGTEVAHTLPGGSCTQPYDIPAPCPATLPATFEVDTRKLTDGAHTAQLEVTDAAGQTTKGKELAFTSSNPAPPDPGGGTGGGGSGGGGTGGGTGAGGGTATTPAATALVPVRIELAKRRFTLPARRQAITGVVRRADGTPAAGVLLELRSARFGTGEPVFRTERTLRTDASGAFSAPVGSSSRRLVVEVTDPGYQPAESAEIRVLGTLAIELSSRDTHLRNGSRVTLNAAITGAGGNAADGRILLVQAMVGGRWTTVDSIESNGAGHARWRYRFHGTTRPARYHFRVRIPRGADDWPWPTTSSDEIVVNVRP